MKSFKAYIGENDLCSFPAFYLSRVNMPQIDNITQFEQYVNGLGIETEYVDVSANELRKTQSDYDQSKVDQIIADGGIDSKPIVISSDYFVLDGHHRAIAAEQSGLNIRAVRVNLPINKLLKLAIDYTESYD